jgi:hypothetical protein
MMVVTTCRKMFFALGDRAPDVRAFQLFIVISAASRRLLFIPPQLANGSLQELPFHLITSREYLASQSRDADGSFCRLYRVAKPGEIPTVVRSKEACRRGCPCRGCSSVGMDAGEASST